MTLEAIRARIQENLDCTHVQIIDLGGGDHIRAVVVSPKFAGLPLLKQHNLVLDLFQVEINSNEVHALTVKTLTPEQFEKL